MAVKLPCFWLLLLFSLSRADKKTCLNSASSCNECVQSGSMCSWCIYPQDNVRCSTLNALEKAGCPKKYIYNPAQSMQVIKNASRTNTEDTKTVFLQPQELSLHLRPGGSLSFLLTVSMPTDQPEVNMDLSSMPAGVNVTIRSLTIGNPELLQVNVDAAQCPSNSEQNESGPWSILITPRGFSLSIKSGNCTGNREEASPDCSGHGALVCGRCECYEPYFGQHCQINSDSFLLHEESLCCLGPNAPACSGRGQCVAGFCEYNTRKDPNQPYSGQYCECSNFDCPRHNNRLCGGNGICKCGSCVCHPKWTGETCSCGTDTTSCLATNQKLCNGKVMCVCGTCKCEPPYSGPTREDGPVCPRCVCGVPHV